MQMLTHLDSLAPRKEAKSIGGYPIEREQIAKSPLTQHIESLYLPNYLPLHVPSNFWWNGHLWKITSMLKRIQASRVGLSSQNGVSQGRSDRLTTGRVSSGAAPHPSHTSCHPPMGRGALTFQTLMQQKGTFEVFIWETKGSLYLDSRAAFKAPVQTELCVSNSSALSIHMPEILIPL